MNDDTHTASSSHAEPAPHAFLKQLQPKKLEDMAKQQREFELRVEQRTADGIEAALNSLEDIPGVPGKLRFKVSVSDEGYQVHCVMEKNIITPPEGLVS